MNNTAHTYHNKLAYCGVSTRRDMTNEERYRLVNSIYSNPKRLTVAYFILSSKQCTSEQIIEATGFNKSTVSHIVSEMVAAGAASITESDIDGRSFFISLTEVGKKLLRF